MGSLPKRMRAVRKKEHVRVNIRIVHNGDSGNAVAAILDDGHHLCGTDGEPIVTDWVHETVLPAARSMLVESVARDVRMFYPNAVIAEER